MCEKFMNLVEDLSDSMPTFLAVILAILIFIVAAAIGLVIGVGIALGWFCLIGWILSLVYGVLATTFNWPTFSFWFFVGAAFLLNLFFGKGVMSRIKKGE